MTSIEKWPYEFRSVLESAQKEQVEFKNIKVFCLDGAIWDWYYIIRFQASPEVLRFLQNEWHFSPLKDDGTWAKWFQANIPSQWREPPSSDADFFVCPERLAGEKGNCHVIMHDKTHGVVFVYHYFNF